jgi:hypothetical protein
VKSVDPAIREFLEQGSAVIVGAPAIDEGGDLLRFRSKANHVQRGRFFFSTNDQNSSSSRSVMRLGATGSLTLLAALRISLSTVFVLMESTRLMSRMPEPLIVIGRTSERTPALQA